MTDKKGKPSGEAGRIAQTERAARQAAALRANLLKRKDQMRKRADARTEPPLDTPGSDDSGTG